MLGITVGLGAAVTLLAALLPPLEPSARTWALAATIVAVVALAVNWLPALRDTEYALDQQRRAYAGTIERTALERCAADQSRPDLPPVFQFLREHIPEHARFVARPDTLLPCLTLNLMPRLPVSEEGFDPARDWVIYDGAPAAIARRAERDEAQQAAQRRFLTAGSSFVLVRPGPETLP